MFIICMYNYVMLVSIIDSDTPVRRWHFLSKCSLYLHIIRELSKESACRFAFSWSSYRIHKYEYLEQ